MGNDHKSGTALAVARAAVPRSKADFARTQDEERVQMLADLLLCSQQCVHRMACNCPEVLTMAPAEITQRLMLLKVPLDSSDSHCNPD